MPLVRERDERVVPIDNETKLQGGDRVFWLVNTEFHDEAETWLTEQGWRFDPEPDAASDPDADSFPDGPPTRTRST
ncbi:MAG: hypothetical protein ABIF77_16495 [bacterium]